MTPKLRQLKVYLFLKIGCECKPLEYLLRYGCFNSINLNNVELSTSAREYLEENPGATALFEYACLTNDKGEQVSESWKSKLKTIRQALIMMDFPQCILWGFLFGLSIQSSYGRRQNIFDGSVHLS